MESAQDTTESGIAGSSQKPLCVDLDRALIKTSTLMEGILAILSSRQKIARAALIATADRPAFKQRVAVLADLAPELLPYNKQLIDYLCEQKRRGRPIVLATGADESLARAIADYLGIFDLVIASDGIRNLAGEAKAAELVRRFGRKNFDYIGASRADSAMRREADRFIAAETSTAAEGAGKGGEAAGEVFLRQAFWPLVLRAMRPHQWVKNLLVFVPLLASRSITDWPGLLGAFYMFVAFCAAASGIYLFNDLMDLRADRLHPRKRDRPFASGALSLSFGLVFAGVLIAGGFSVALLCGAASLLSIYAAISLAYSLAFKNYPLLDVFILAALYTLRIVAGGVASHHLASLWLLAFSGFTFLSLALVKRVSDMPQTHSLGSNDRATRRGYFSEDRLILIIFGVASAFSSSVVLALFVGSTAAFQQYRTPEILWGLVPLVLFWQCRLWLSTERGFMDDDPIIYASRDWVSWLVAIAATVIVALASLDAAFW
jgi:4-hydroxybenzoate polyprenyltransferase/phosphoserine phosphatase